MSLFSRITNHASRLTHQASRLAHHASRLTHHASSVLLNSARTPTGAPAQPSGGRNLTDLILTANRWREQYNPLRGLDISRVISLREAWLRGEYADIQWLYYHIEKSYPELMALRTRRLSAISKLDWQIKTCGEDKPGYDEAAAEAQAAYLRECYDRLDNLQHSINHLAGATMHGLAALEKHGGDSGAIEHLEPCDPWNIIRNGLRGGFRLNPRADSTTYSALPASNDLDPARWLIREVDCHIDWIATVLFVRASLCEKDWDGFVEIYGVPGAIVLGPPNVPPDKATEYEDAARDVADGASGYLPYGSDVKFPSEVRGNSPFRERLQHITEQLVLCGTGGLLTMLSQPTGIGQGASGEHADVFSDIAAAEAAEISEIFQRQFDLPLLQAQFPGEPVLAYWELAAEEETDVTAAVQQIGGLKAAGYVVSPEEASDRTGYTLEAAPQAVAPPVAPAPAAEAQAAGPEDDPEDQPNPSDPSDPSEPSESEPILNSASSIAQRATEDYYRALAEDLQPLRERLARILQISDPDILRARLAALKAELPQLLRDINADPASAQALQPILAQEIARGAKAAESQGGVHGLALPAGGSALLNNSWEGQPRDSLGLWVDENGGGLSVDDNIARGSKAIDRALRQHADVQKAMHRKEVGRIDFIWGTPGQTAPNANGVTHSGGFGISHVLAKHGEADVRSLPVLLAKGSITNHPDSPAKRIVTHEANEAILVKQNSRKAWVLTGFRRQVG